MILAGNRLGLVDMVIDIVKKIAYLYRGEVIIHNNNKLLLRGINSEIYKSSQYTLEARAVIIKNQYL